MKPMQKPIKTAKPKKHKKKTPRQKMVRQLDELIREIVFLRDPYSVPLVYKEVLKENGAVEYAMNHRGVDQPGHVVSRKNKPVCWDLRNVHKQDANDNLLHEYYPEVYNQWYIKTFGLDSWNDLVNDSRKVWKYSMDDLETLYIELIEIQKTLQANQNWKPYFSQKEIITGEWRKYESTPT